MSRILVITQFFPPEGQGGGHRWPKLIQNSSENLEYRVVCPPPTYPYGDFERTYRLWQTEEYEGIPVTRLWTYQPGEDVGSLGRILNYGIFAIAASLYLLVNFWRFDGVVTMSTPHTTFLPGAISRLLGRAWIVDIFDLWLDNAADLDYVDVDTIGYRFVSRLEELAITRADTVIVLTPTMRDYYMDKYELASEDRFAIVPFGIDDDLFTPELERSDKDRVIYVGNLGTFYAFDPFFEAFARLDGSVELYMVGWGERRDELEDLCEELGIDDRVTFTGKIPRKDVAELLATSAVSWVPLSTEYRLDYARPTKMLESMAVGTPYIASRVQEVEVVTEASHAGVLVDNEPDTIAKEMEWLLANPDRRTEMGQNGVEYIRDEHNWRRLGKRVGDALEQACTGG